MGQSARNESALGVMMADVVQLDDGTYRMYYGATLQGATSAIKYAESADGITWTVKGTALPGASSSTDRESIISGPSIVRLPDGRYRMYYQSSPMGQPGQPTKLHVRSAVSTDGKNFVREGIRMEIQDYDPSSPLRLAGHGAYFIASDGTYVAIFSGEFATDPMRPSDLKLATSADGLTFGNFQTLYVGWHDPIVIKTRDGYRVFATYLLEKQGTAFSSDGKTWPAEMTTISLVDQAAKALTESNSGVGDLGGVLLPSGDIRIFANYGNPSTDIVYLDEAP